MNAVRDTKWSLQVLHGATCNQLGGARAKGYEKKGADRARRVNVRTPHKKDVW